MNGNLDLSSLDFILTLDCLVRIDISGVFLINFAIKLEGNKKSFEYVRFQRNWHEVSISKNIVLNELSLKRNKYPEKTQLVMIMENKHLPKITEICVFVEYVLSEDVAN